MSPSTEEETTWVAEYGLDVTRQRPSGIYAAVLLADNVFARLAATQLGYENEQAALTYRLFNDEDESATWLGQPD